MMMEHVAGSGHDPQVRWLPLRLLVSVFRLVPDCLVTGARPA